MKILTIIFCLTLASNSAFSNEEGAFLDSPYKRILPPIKEKNSINKSFGANDVESIIAHQSPIRSQSSRGTCSIFSATAYLEGLLIKKGFDPSIDLSEEWLEYTAVRNSPSDGSSAWPNFSAIRDYGMPSEQLFPYIGEDWLTVFNPLKEQRCGKLLGPVKNSCLIVHRDPTLLDLTDAQIEALNNDQEFIIARREALDFKNKNIKFGISNFYISSVSEVKNLLQNELPVVLEVYFYYGAWNHSGADEYGIGRNYDHWTKGIVAYPEVGSLDRANYSLHPAGHSILIVGYDDDRVVEKTMKMADGTKKSFSYKGVYYFKNSWGTSSFGREFQINGVVHPGYGMITAKYAEELGQFFKMPLL